MKNIILFITLIVGITGCGGGSSSNSNSTYEGPMVLEKEYTMFPGDRVEKTSTSSSIKVTHIDGKTESNIELISGEASIIRTP